LESENVHKPNGKALFPLGVFFLLYLFTWFFTGDIGKMPVSIAFLSASVVAVFFSKGGKISHRIDLFCAGAANKTIIFMVIIFILAGAFAGATKAMGAVETTVNIILYLIPGNVILAGIFVAACFMSMSMGTSCGTIAALAPITVGISAQLGIELPHTLGIVVGGAMFGDNLSYISDTTIVATRTQECRMKDKFNANIRLVLPAALLVLIVYGIQGVELSNSPTIATGEIEWLKGLPYLTVLVMALAGVNVITVLTAGILLSGLIGIFSRSFLVWDWVGAMSNGIVSNMGELIIVSLMAGGMFEMIRFNGGIDWLILRLTKNIHSPRKAETAIAGLISFTNLCTANNTIALIITGPIAKTISDKFSLDKRRVASILDTFSCFIQGLLPYGAQLLIISGIAGISPIEIIPHIYYSHLMGIFAIMGIILQWPKLKQQS